MGEAGGGLLGTYEGKDCMEAPMKTRRPPSLPPLCIVLPAYSSFSVLREVPVAFSCDYFKKPNGYKSSIPGKQ
jgi:hypothetical protein